MRSNPFTEPVPGNRRSWVAKEGLHAPFASARPSGFPTGCEVESTATGQRRASY